MKDGSSAQTGLEGIQKNKLKPFVVIVNRDAPFAVMIFYHERVTAWPVATLFHLNPDL